MAHLFFSSSPDKFPSIENKPLRLWGSLKVSTTIELISRLWKAACVGIQEYLSFGGGPVFSELFGWIVVDLDRIRKPATTLKLMTELIPRSPCESKGESNDNDCSASGSNSFRNLVAGSTFSELFWGIVIRNNPPATPLKIVSATTSWWHDQPGNSKGKCNDTDGSASGSNSILNIAAALCFSCRFDPLRSLLKDFASPLLPSEYPMRPSWLRYHQYLRWKGIASVSRDIHNLAAGSVFSSWFHGSRSNLTEYSLPTPLFRVSAAMTWSRYSKYNLKATKYKLKGICIGINQYPQFGSGFRFFELIWRNTHCRHLLSEYPPQ